MKVFISWSGSRSKIVAEIFRKWLPLFIQEIDPWMSSDDIDKGKMSVNEIAKELEDTKVGIICLTKENLNRPWLHFEAGALSKTIHTSFVCPFLLDLAPTDIDTENPLRNFQATINSKEDVLKLLKTINKASGNEMLDDERLGETFEKWWPDFEKKISTISPSTEEEGQHRSRRDSDILAEILETVRNLERRRHTIIA
ncbi:MAG: TIR domain-containing protein [Candidatus Methanospirareceae archaeon]